MNPARHPHKQPAKSSTSWSSRSAQFSIATLAAAVLVAQGAGPDAVDDILYYGQALATDTLPEPGTPPAIYRWITGNADPLGRLPWPFGATDYLVWWATASWPLWLASIPAIAYLLFATGTTASRRLAAGWAIAAWAQVALPGLYWQHYYLLSIAGAAVAVAVCIADATTYLSQVFRPASKNDRHIRKALVALVSAPLLLLAFGATAYLEVRDYLLVEPEQLTIRFKGGGQWVVLREMGRDLGRRGRIWNHPHLYIWGWQSPLHFYARMDSPTRHFFVDNLLRDQADRDHRLIRPRHRGDHRHPEAQPTRTDLHGLPAVPIAPGISERSILPFQHGARIMGAA